MNQEKYKKGDKLICILGFTSTGYSGGSGYIDGRIITVKNVSSTSGNNDTIIYWPKETTPNDSGIYGKALKLYQPDKVINDYLIY